MLVQDMVKFMGAMQMNTVGIIGGIGPESTIEYYRLIISSYLGKEKRGNYPQIIINSINMKWENWLKVLSARTQKMSC